MDKQQFKAIRQRLGQTPEQFAITLGKSLRSIRYYETNLPDMPPIPKHVEIFVLRLAAEKDFQEKCENVSAKLA